MSPCFAILQLDMVSSQYPVVSLCWSLLLLASCTVLNVRVVLGCDGVGDFDRVVVVLGCDGCCWNS